MSKGEAKNKVLLNSTCSIRNGQRYLDVQSAAVYLGRTPGAVSKLVARRLIPFRRQGKRLFFDVVALDEWMAGLEGVDAKEAVARVLHGGTIKDL